jgi:release factor glutamine methyltransferase
MREVAPSLRLLLDQGAQRLRRAGIGEPRRHVLRLWRELLDGSASRATMLEYDRRIDPAMATRFRQAVERYGSGEPLPHVTGWTGFRHLMVRSDGRALIPRPETEGLVELLLCRVQAGLVADIGTGTGCLALSLATEGGFRRIVAVDRSADALALARLNLELVGAAGRIDLVQGDLCAPLGTAMFDALISNPPYLTAGEYADLDSSVRDWEPASALVSGEDGLETTIRLLDDGRRVVRPGGWLALELDSSRAQQVATRAGCLGWQDVSIHMDLFGRERYLLARRSETL